MKTLKERMEGRASAGGYYADWWQEAMDRIVSLEEALGFADSWLESHAVHVGNCKGGDVCTCGLTRIRFDVRSAMLTDDGDE